MAAVGGEGRSWKPLERAAGVIVAPALTGRVEQYEGIFEFAE